MNYQQLGFTKDEVIGKAVQAAEVARQECEPLPFTAWAFVAGYMEAAGYKVGDLEAMQIMITASATRYPVAQVYCMPEFVLF